MTMRMWCARCGWLYEVLRTLAGRRVRCRACGHVQRVPEPAVPLPPPLSEPAPSLAPTSHPDGSDTYAMAPAPSPAPPPTTPRRTSKPTPSPMPTRREHLADLAAPGHLQEWSMALVGAMPPTCS